MNNKTKIELSCLVKAEHAEMEELIKYLNPLLDKVVNDYIENQTNSKFNITYNALYAESIKLLPIAVKKYLERYRENNWPEDKYVYFIDYYSWYARQGIVEYLNTLLNKA